MLQALAIEAVVHGVGDDVLSRRVHTMQEIDAVSEEYEAEGRTVYIEDMAYTPVVDKMIALMKAQELTFGWRKHFFAYIGGRPFKYGDNPPSSFVPSAITLQECRVAAQRHIQFLTGHDLEEELAYIEEQYNLLINADVPIGQTSIYEYMETDAV